MRILGVDPGIATVGFAVLDAEKRSQRLLTCGVITTPAKTQLSSRLDQIYRDLNELIAQFHPEVMAVEELFFNTNITTGIAVAHGRGIILLSGYQAGLQIYEYTPLQVKSSVTGYGRAPCRSSRRSSVMAVRTKSRSWTWCVASCPCRPCRSRTTRRTPSLSRSAMRAAPHL